MIVFGFNHRAITVWDLSAGKLRANLWPVQGGHWAATSEAGAADASAPRGRETILTLVTTGKGAATRIKRPQTALEAGPAGSCSLEAAAPPGP